MPNPPHQQFGEHVQQPQSGQTDPSNLQNQPSTNPNNPIQISSNIMCQRQPETFMIETTIRHTTTTIREYFQVENNSPLERIVQNQGIEEPLERRNEFRTQNLVENHTEQNPDLANPQLASTQQSVSYNTANFNGQLENTVPRRANQPNQGFESQIIQSGEQESSTLPKRVSTQFQQSNQRLDQNPWIMEQPTAGKSHQRHKNSSNIFNYPNAQKTSYDKIQIVGVYPQQQDLNTQRIQQRPQQIIQIDKEPQNYSNRQEQNQQLQPGQHRTTNQPSQPSIIQDSIAVNKSYKNQQDIDNIQSHYKPQHKQHSQQPFQPEKNHAQQCFRQRHKFIDAKDHRTAQGYLQSERYSNRFITDSPVREISTKRDIHLKYEQLGLTEQKKEPWELSVPTEEYHNGQEDQNQQEVSLPKPLQEYEIDGFQRRITDYVGENSLSLRNKKKIQKATLKSNEEQYKVIVKQPSPVKSQKPIQEFYKDNDIYGVETLIEGNQNIQKSQERTQNLEKENYDQPKFYQSVPNVEIDRPSPENYESEDKPYQAHEIKSVNGQNEKIPVLNEGQPLHQGLESNIKNLPVSGKTQPQKQQISGNLVVSNISQTHSELNAAQNAEAKRYEKFYKTEPKRMSEEGINFYSTEKGDLIYTEECYKEPMSCENIKGVVEPVIKVEPEKLQLQIENQEQKREGQKKSLEQKFPEIQSAPSHKKTIVYRKEQELEQILDYLGMQEVKEELKQQKPATQQQLGSLNEKKQQQRANSQKPSQFILLDIDQNINLVSTDQNPRLSHLQPHYVSDEQVEMNLTNPLIDKPHPVVNSNQLSNQSQTKSNKTKLQPRKTKRKQLIKGNTSRKYATPKKQDDAASSTSSKRMELRSGSVYHFELIPAKSSNRKNLVQVRRSSRIFSKSKQNRLNPNNTLDQIQEVEIDHQTHALKTDVPVPDGSGAKSKQKISEKKPTAKSKSKPKTQQQREQDQLITLEWLKQHMGELHEIVVDQAYMYDEYRAMTENDEAISRFLQELENTKSKKTKIAPSQDQTSEHPQPIPENQIMKRIPKPAQNKQKISKDSKRQNTKSKSRFQKSKKKVQSKIKIQKTVQITLNNQDQNFRQNQSDMHAFSHQVQVDRPAQPKIEQQQNNPNEGCSKSPQNSEKKKQIFNQNKAKFRVPEEFPITVQKVIDPDILGLGVYALIKLGRLSEFQLGTKYAITPICLIRFAKKKNVLEALKQSKRLVPPEYADNIALVGLNSMLISLINKVKQEQKINQKSEVEKQEIPSHQPEKNQKKEQREYEI